MAQKRRLEIFFIFYLTSLAGFIVLTLEKNKDSAQIFEQHERFLHAFLTPPDIHFDRDTVYCYVSANDSGDIRDTDIPFRTQIYVSGFDAEDSLQVRPYALHFGNSFISPSVVTVGDRQAYGAISDQRVSYPIEVALRRIGKYSLDIEVHASYLRRISSSEIRFHGRTLPADLFEGDSLEKMQTQRKRLTIVVEDTTQQQRAKFVKGLVLNCDRSTISSALGFEDSNRLSTNLDYLEPSMRVVKGCGRVEKRSDSENRVAYVWMGQVKYQADTVCLEARVNREAGGRDIARVSFAVKGEMPLLQSSIPNVCYAGEGLHADFRVAGLSNPAMYSYSLSLMRTDGEQFLSREHSGSALNIQINAENADKTLRIRAYYNGKPYRYLSPRTLSGGISVFDIAIKTPPYHIDFTPPQKVGTSYAYEFRVYRFSDPKYKEIVEIADIRSVQFEMIKSTGERVRLIAEALRSGYLRYRISTPELIQPKGEEVAIEIKTPQTSIRKKVFIYRDAF